MQFVPTAEISFAPAPRGALPQHVELCLGDAAEAVPTPGMVDVSAPADIRRTLAEAHVAQLYITMRDLGAATRHAGALQQIIDAVPAAVPVAMVAAAALDAAATTAAVAICQRWRKQGRPLRVEFVLQADAEVARIGRASTSLSSVLEASRLFVAGGIVVRWVIPLRPELIPRLDTLHSLAHATGAVPVVAIPGELSPIHAVRTTTLDADTALFLRDFVAYRLLEEDAALVDAAMQGRLRALLDGLVSGRAETTPQDVLVLASADAAGSRWRLGRAQRTTLSVAGDVPASIAAASSGGFWARLATVADMAAVVGEGLLALMQWLLAQGSPPDPRGIAAGIPARLPRVLVIGAYGGEHIGDAAILGGVLLRVHRRFGTSSAMPSGCSLPLFRPAACLRPRPVSIWPCRRSAAISVISKRT